MNPCNNKIYENGTVVFITHTLSSQEIESWVKEVALLSGQPVDWHFAAGRAIVKALGDIEFVRDTIQQLLPQHNELMRKELLKYDRISQVQEIIDGIAVYSGYSIVK